MYPVIALPDSDTIPNDAYFRTRRNTIGDISLNRDCNHAVPRSPTSASKNFFNKLWKNRRSLSPGSQKKDSSKLNLSADEEVQTCSVSPSAIRRSISRRFSQVPENSIEYMITAVQHQDIHTINKLLVDDSCKYDINDTKTNGASIFHFACMTGNTKVAKLFVSRGADIHLKTHGNLSPLKLAALFGNYELAQYLIDQGADSNDVKNGIQRTGEIQLIDA